MAKGGGGGGDPSAFTGGGLLAPPPGGMTPSSPAVIPSYPNFLPSSGDVMATPQSVSAAYNSFAAQPPKPPPAAAAAGTDVNSLRQMLAQYLASSPASPTALYNQGDANAFNLRAMNPASSGYGRSANVFHSMDPKTGQISTGYAPSTGWQSGHGGH